MNQIQVTLRGNVATEPRHVRFDDGNTLTSFRLASTARYFDRDRREWVDRGTTYMSVICRKAMASNAAASVRKGHPLVVTGRLRERFWSSNGRSGQSLEIEADTVGHDLSFGTTEFVRIVRAERVEQGKDTQGDEMTYLHEEAEAGPEGIDRSITDVSGFTVLEDGEGPDQDHESDDRSDGPDDGSDGPDDESDDAPAVLTEMMSSSGVA
jgi:single-strand DNA-binding protein